MRFVEASGVFLGTAATTFALFKALEETSRKEARDAVSRWLLNDDKISLSSITMPMVLRALIVSYLARPTALSLLACSATYSLATTIVVSLTIFGMPWGPSQIFVPFFAGLLPDCLSLMKSRYIVLSESFTRHQYAFLLFDVLLSLIITVGGLVAAAPLVERLVGEHSSLLLIVTLFTIMAPTLVTATLAVFATLTRLGLRLLRFDLRKTSSLLNYSERPFQALGITLSPIIGAICGTIALLV
jgi:hypothetical protein